MKIKNVKLEWNVLYHDFNKDIIRPYNVLWKGLPEAIAKQIRCKKINNRKDLEAYLKTQFMSSYWCRAEYEILVSGLFVRSHTEATKIDIWYQIEMNFNLIVDYIIYKMKLEY